MSGDANLLLFVLVHEALVSATADANSGRLIAVHSSPYARQLYQKLRNKDAILEASSVTLDTQAQQRTCQDITGSGFFDLPHLMSNETRKIYRNWSDQGYSNSSQSLGSSRTSSNSSSASYEPLRAHLRMASVNLCDEYSFTCVLEDSPDYPYYVSAEYHVGEFDKPHMPGRFLFGNFVPGRRYSDQEMILAETPAVVHEEEGFNVEIHYLQTRKGRQPAENNDSDPVCKLVSTWRRDPNNQHYRLCVAVSRSSDFVDKIRYPHPTPYPCSEIKISFRTEAGVKGAADQTYHERMTLCYSTLVDSRASESFLYISRAYASNKVYVYSQDPVDGEVYLKNLSTNVNIVDEENHER